MVLRYHAIFMKKYSYTETKTAKSLNHQIKHSHIFQDLKADYVTCGTTVFTTFCGIQSSLNHSITNSKIFYM